jgi:CheY-like chemotaxis protein
VNLPDIDGFWVARRVRAEATEVSATPFLFLTDAEDVQARLHGLNVGADLFLTKPFRSEEVVAQVGAMIDMARRLKTASMNPASNPPPSSSGPAAFQGNLAEMAISTVLTVLELERRTGELKVRDETGSSARLELVDGAAVRAELHGKQQKPIAWLREMLRWNRGSFQFRSKQVASSAEAQNLSALLLDAMRLQDELGRD